MKNPKKLIKDFNSKKQKTNFSVHLKNDWSISEYKTTMLFKNIYFDVDKSTQYFAVREIIPTIYYEDKGLFGPTWSPSLPLNFSESSKEE